MVNSATETPCLHCNAILTPKDIADGWCDACGKRVPISIKGSKSKPAAVAPVDIDIPDSHHTPRWVWAVTTVVVLGVVALVFFTRGG
jgi:hypothetical protein